MFAQTVVHALMFARLKLFTRNSIDVTLSTRQPEKFRHGYPVLCGPALNANPAGQPGNHAFLYPGIAIFLLFLLHIQIY